MDQLIVPHKLHHEMLDHVQSCLPEEACGLLAGDGYRVTKVYPVTNQYHSPDRFWMDAQEQVSALSDMECNRWDLLAIYHSHPKGLEYPSATDIQEVSFPGSLYLIWFPSSGIWACRAFRLENGAYHEEALIQAE